MIWLFQRLHLGLPVIYLLSWLSHCNTTLISTIFMKGTQKYTTFYLDHPGLPFLIIQWKKNDKRGIKRLNSIINALVITVNIYTHIYMLGIYRNMQIESSTKHFDQRYQLWIEGRTSRGRRSPRSQKDTFPTLVEKTKNENQLKYWN